MPENTAGQSRTTTIPNRHTQVSTGRVVFDATAITAADYVEIDVGYTPRYVCWENITDRIKIEWYEGMAANTCIKTAAAGTRTLETTNGGITLSGNSFQVTQNATLGAVAASKDCTWITMA